MNAENVRDIFEDLGRALDRLAEATQLDVSVSDIVIDGTVQRFEFTIELFWKALKRLLEYGGIFDARNPRAVLKRAYAEHWLDDEQAWIDMLNDRDLLSHLYSEQVAMDVYPRIPAYLARMRSVYERLNRERVSGLEDE